jgi:hypothetical protein
VIRLVLLALAAAAALYLVLRWRRERREDAIARIRSAFLVPRVDRPASRRQPPRLKSVALGDGLLRFQVPEAWEEEPAAGAYCARASTSRRLRVQVGTVEPGAASAAALADVLRESPRGRKGTVEVLSGDRVLVKHVRSGPDAAGPAVTYCWELVSPRPSGAAVLAEFSFSVPLEAADAITEDDLLLLEREIRAAAFPLHA